MTKNEAGVVVKMISTFYPNEYSKLTPEAMAMIVKMWAVTCESYTGEQVAAALQQYMAVDLTGFAPKPGQLIQYIVLPEDDKDMNSNDAWAMYQRAVSNGIYGADEEYAKMPPIMQRVVGSAYNIHEAAKRELTGFDEGNFKRAYNIELERERTKRRLPPSTRRLLEGGGQEALPG